MPGTSRWPCRWPTATPAPPARSASRWSPADPGLTQCGTSLIAAYRGKTPLVVIAGEIQPGAKNKTQSMDQRRFVEASSARFFTVTSLDNMAEEIAEAFYAARTGRGPVVLNLPMDLQEKAFDWDYEYRPSTEFLPPRMETPSPDLLAPVIEKLIAAERPVIIAGRGARAANAKEEIDQGWPTASARCWQRRCKAKAISPVIPGTSASPARSPRHRRNSCWPTPTSCWESARSLATTPRKAACCSRRPKSRVSTSSRCRRRSASSPACMCRATAARRWPRSTKRWKPARCARKVSATPRPRRCSMRRRISSTRRRMVSIRARWPATLVPRCRRARC